MSERTITRASGRRRHLTRAALLAATAMLTAAGLHAADAAPQAPYQLNVQKDLKWNGGEPEIAVNPRNPDNLVMVWAAMKVVRPNTGPVQGGVESPSIVHQFTPITGPGGTSCQMAVSFNRGKSWIGTRFPFADQPSCGDPMVVSDARGNFYVSFDSMGDYLLQQRYSYSVVDYVKVARSTDGGRSWSEPTNTWTYVDRPFTRVDPKTNWIYVMSGGFGTPRKLAISKDQARTWSTPVELAGSRFAVAYGLLATASGSNGQLMFNLTRDGGRTVTPIPVKGATGGTGGWISADPTRAGRFAVMDQVGNVFRVFVTNDAGRTWSKAAQVTNDRTRAITKPWMEYGPNGVLAVMWKSDLAEASGFEVYAALSRTGGLAFSKPIRVSSKPSPPPDPADGAGDDLSWVTVDKTDVHLGWGDRRDGETQAYYARIPLRDFPR